MKKALFVSTIISFLGAFETGDIQILQRMGYAVHIACNCKEYSTIEKVKLLEELRVIKHDIPFSRTPLSVSNLKAYAELKTLLKEEKFELIHCHTPVGGVLGRLAANSVGVKNVIYTAHGFHFYNGAPMKNWILFYPLEKWLSRYTDILITINREDYERALKKFHAKHTVYVPGVGIDTKKFGLDTEGERIRKEVGILSDRVMLLSVGELNQNKNHEAVINAIVGMENITYVVVGDGPLHDYLKQMAIKRNVDVRFMGYRNDVADFYDAADIYILPSIREGLNVSLMEAMASGLPCLVGNIRGNIDLIDEDKGGYLFNPFSIESIRDTIKKAVANNSLCLFGLYNRERIKNFDGAKVKEAAERAYDASCIATESSAVGGYQGNWQK